MDDRKNLSMIISDLRNCEAHFRWQNYCIYRLRITSNLRICENICDLNRFSIWFTKWSIPIPRRDLTFPKWLISWKKFRISLKNTQKKWWKQVSIEETSLLMRMEFMGWIQFTIMCEMGKPRNIQRGSMNLHHCLYFGGSQSKWSISLNFSLTGCPHEKANLTSTSIRK